MLYSTTFVKLVCLKGSCISPCMVFDSQMCVGLLCRRKQCLLLCSYCVVATGSQTLTVKASYTNT